MNTDDSNESFPLSEADPDEEGKSYLIQWDERYPNGLNKLYSRLKDIFDKCNSQTVENRDGIGYLRLIDNFFHIYNKNIRQNVLDKLSKNKAFEDTDKIGLNCFCVSINIMNLNMDKITEIVYIHQLLDFLDEFRKHSELSAVARRLTETILYCLCNYCNNTNRRGNKRIDLTNNNKQCLKDCFMDPQSNKIKLAAAIIMCFLDSPDDQLGNNTRIHLRSINGYYAGRYLGIDKELIGAAIGTESQATENRAENKESKTINILLLGETGVGKSTWINGFINYLSYDSLEEAENGKPVSVIPTAFTLTDSDFNEHIIRYSIDRDKTESTEDVGESATKMPKSYVFNMQNVKIRIIDTPGMGATGGIDQDKENMQNILYHLSEYKELNGIIILLKPNNARLNVMFEFCIKEMITYLHKDACKNILICFTNARGSSYRPGDTMPVLKELLKKNNKIDIKLTKDTVYCMDNESVRYLMAMNTIGFDESEREDYVSSWRKAVEESKRMISHIYSLKPHTIQDTISINEIRRSIIEQSRPMGHVVQAIQKNIDEIKEKVAEEIDVNKSKDKLHKTLLIPTTRIKVIPLDHPRTVCTAPKCIEYIPNEDGSLRPFFKSICHDRCHETTAVKNVIGDSALNYCAVMVQGWSLFWYYCKKCECYSDTHMQITYEIIEETVEVEDPEIRKLLNENDGDIKAIKKHKLQLECKLKQLNYEQKRLTEINAHFACFLKHNSILPYNDTLLNYLDHLIKNEKGNVESNNSSKTLEGLINLKKLYEKEKRVIEERIEKDTNAIQSIDMENINKLMKELKELPNIGAMFKDIMTSVRKANDASLEFAEMVIEVPPTNVVSQLIGMIQKCLTNIFKTNN